MSLLVTRNGRRARGCSASAHGKKGTNFVTQEELDRSRGTILPE